MMSAESQADVTLSDLYFTTLDGAAAHGSEEI